MERNDSTEIGVAQGAQWGRVERVQAKSPCSPREIGVECYEFGSKMLV